MIFICILTIINTICILLIGIEKVIFYLKINRVFKKTGFNIKNVDLDFWGGDLGVYKKDIN